MIRRLSKVAQLPNSKADKNIKDDNAFNDDNNGDANYARGDGGEVSVDDDSDVDDDSADESDNDGEIQGKAQGTGFVDNMSLQLLYMQLFTSLVSL